MKSSRCKKATKILSYYANNFKYRQPYQILVDATFCQAALQNKIAIHEQLHKYLQCGIKLHTTQCLILEAESLGTQLSGATSIVKQFLVHKCGHEGKPVSGSDCMKAMVKTNRYIIATQDRKLQDRLRKIPGQALIYLYRCRPVLDPPSESSKKHVSNKITKLFNENDSLKAIKKMKGISTGECPTMNKKKKKPKNPNPLSCKKKRKSKL